MANKPGKINEIKPKEALEIAEDLTGKKYGNAFNKLRPHWLVITITFTSTVILCIIAGIGFYKFGSDYLAFPWAESKIATSVAGTIAVVIPPLAENPPCTVIPNITSTNIPTPAITPTTKALPTVDPNNLFSSTCLFTKNWYFFLGSEPVNPQNKSKDACWEIANIGIYTAIENGYPGVVLSTNSADDKRVHRLLFREFPTKDIVIINLAIEIEELDYIQNSISEIILGIGTIEEWLNNGNFLFFQYPNKKIYYNTSLKPSSAILKSNYKFSTFQSPNTIIVNLQIVYNSLSIHINGKKVIEKYIANEEWEGFWIGYSIPAGGGIKAKVLEIQTE
ncbi:MAG: hypothetical protein OEZ01_17660 [Candidatus Heimdallarchaeota archaeon]|nr:hypothetical protein [Candidatus Heimdallarchaeota archaeon]